MGDHIAANGQFQSDKYPTCPAGKVPLSTRDLGAQDLLWEYAQRRRPIDAEFSADLETCLKTDGFNAVPKSRFILLSPETLTAIEIALQERLTGSRKLLHQGGPHAPGIGEELARIIGQSEAALKDLEVICL